MSPRFRSRLPLLLLLALVGALWRRTGGPPLRSGGPWAGIGLAILLLGLFVRLLAPAVGARRGVRLGGGILAGSGFALWLAAMGRAAVHGPHRGSILLLGAAFAGYAAWGWWRQRPPPSPPGA